MPEKFKTLPSVEGYLNVPEIQRVILATLGATTITQFALEILNALIANAGTIYTGPNPEIVVPILSALAGLLTARKIGSKFLRDGVRTR